MSLLDHIRKDIPLSLMGGAYIGLCPFHEEKVGSFVVDPVKQTYHCFGCGIKGSSIEGYDRLKATLKMLDKKAGIE